LDIITYIGNRGEHGGEKKFKYVTTRPSSPPQFDVSFPENLLKIVATRGEIFNLKFTKYRLAAGLRPDLLGELKRRLLVEYKWICVAASSYDRLE